MMIHLAYKFYQLRLLITNLKTMVTGLMIAELLSHVLCYRKLLVSAHFICTHLHYTDHK